MQTETKKYILPVVVFLLFSISVFLFYLDWQNSHKQFTFAMLNIGQGDALFIESPSGTQVLIDGGPPNKILGKLNQVMSPFDRSIDAIIITNPDQDHIGGLLDVLKFYKVGKVFEPGTWSGSKTYQILEEEIKNKKIPNILAKKGMRLDLGDGAVIDILFPDKDVTDWLTNDGSVVARLSYGNTSFMLTGDASISSLQSILKNNEKKKIQSKILKVSHHGSRNSNTEEFTKVVGAKVALISDGKENKYGHPHQEVLDFLSKLGIKTFRTDEVGTIIIKSDGENEVYSFVN
jgi:beta-lactamase superfamily II metal-dependent hydrolase